MEKNRDKIIQQAVSNKKRFSNRFKKNLPLLVKVYLRHLETMVNYIDYEWGGFKGSPKFPQFYVFESFLHFYKKTKNKKFMML